MHTQHTTSEPNVGGGASVGIDLGTTSSALAWVDPGGHIRTIPNAEAEPRTRSVVFLRKGEVLVGRTACEAALRKPGSAADAFKCDMGEAQYRSKVAGKVRRPELLAAAVLRKLKLDAEQRIGPIRDAVITVPAYFDDNQRKATQDAARIAGLAKTTLLNDSTAAALWFSYHEDDAVGSTFLICDLGGGTFDATLMSMDGPLACHAIATDGDMALGGRDWDACLMEIVCRQFVTLAGGDPRKNPLSRRALLQKIVSAKHTLSQRPSVTIRVTHNGRTHPVHVSRKQFAQGAAGLVRRVQTTCERMLHVAGMGWGDVDRMLLVGGSGRMPMIRDMLAACSPGTPLKDTGQAPAVAHGAALHAAYLRMQETPQDAAYADPAVRETLQKMDHSSVNAHSLGVAARSRTSAHARNITIIPRNTRLPCAGTRTFGKGKSSDSVRVRILEGESPDAGDCTIIGQCQIRGLPPELPPGSPVEVTFAYTEDGRIHISAVATKVNLAGTVTLDRTASLPEEVVEQHTTDLSGWELV